MALDKLVDSTQLDSDLTSVANAIRSKAGISTTLSFPADFVTEIGNIQTGGGGSTTVTVYPSINNSTYSICYMDASGNTVETAYDTLDPIFSGSATIVAKSGSPLAFFLSVGMFESGFVAPNNATLFFSKSATVGGMPTGYVYSNVYIVD